MLYSLYAVLGVCCTRCQLMNMTCRNREGWLNFVFCNDGRVMDQKERDGGWGWERCGEYEWIWEIWGTTCLFWLGRPCIGVITLQIGTRTNCIGDGKLTRTQNSLKTQLLMLIRPIYSHLSPSCPQFYHHRRTRSYVIHLYLSMLWIKSLHRVQLTPSTAYIEYSIQRVQHILNTAYTAYSIHCVLHHPKIDLFPLPATLSALTEPCCTQFSAFPQLRVNQSIDSQLPSHMPPNLLPPNSLPPDSLPPDWLPSDWLPSDQSHPDQPPPSIPPILLDDGLQVYLPSSLITASLNLPPPSASRNPLDHGLQVHLWVRLISQSPSASRNSLYLGLQVHLWVPSFPVSKCISKRTGSQPQSMASRCDGRCTEIQA